MCGWLIFLDSNRLTMGPSSRLPAKRQREEKETVLAGVSLVLMNIHIYWLIFGF